jgi:hypothetical protein
MALFGKIASSGTGNGASSSSTNAFNGVLVLNTGAVAMTAATQQIALQPIANYYGLPESRMNIQITTVDTIPGTAPTTVKGTSTAVYEFQLYGKSGTLILDLKGADNDFLNVPHLLNPYGYYAAEVTGSETTTAGAVYTNTFATVLGLSVDAAEFPLTPVVTIATQSSRASTVGAGNSSTAQMQVWMDFEAHTFARAKLRSYLITGVTTGIFPLQAQLDKNVNVLAQGYYVAADANLASTSTFNFANNGTQLINQTANANFIQKENSLYPSNSHIAGFFPLNIAYTQPFNSNYSTVLQFNIVTAPTVGGVASVIKAHLLEAY